MYTPTLHSVLTLMNVSRINSKPFRHAVLILQPVNRISYFLSAFSLLHFTIMLHSILKAIVHKIYRQMMEQGHPTETGLLIFFPPLLGTTQAIYGTFIPSQIFNASTIYSLLENKACPPIDTRSVRECRFNNITCLWNFFYYF